MPVSHEVKGWFTEGQNGGYFSLGKGIQFHPNGVILEAVLGGASKNTIMQLMEHFGSDGGVVVYDAAQQKNGEQGA